jgi:histone deacetylase complex regulatory component SIN3
MKAYMRQILALPIGQQQTVKLCPENDGYSPLGYTQVIKRLYYTHDKQQQALESLLSSPATALPGFIKLMKQRDADLRGKRVKKNKIQQHA